MTKSPFPNMEVNNIKESEVSFVPYSSPDEAIIGIKNGDIDAVGGGGAPNDKITSIIGVRKIDDLAGAGVSINLYLIAQRSYVEHNSSSIESTLKALNEGITYVENNKEASAKFAYKQKKTARG